MQQDFKPLLINKPAGITSFDVIHKLRKITGIRKIGHTGTLDPLASGLLITLLGKDTKKQAELQGFDKEYIAEITFGIETTTYDREGKIIKEDTRYKEDTKILINTEIEETLKTFLGKQEQTVPPFSAVKIKGQRLYKQARNNNIDLKTLPKRTIEIFSIDLLSLETDQDMDYPVASIKVHCSKGTYIRSLAYDLGKKIGSGAYLSNLVRTKIGPYSLEDAVTLEEYVKNVKVKDKN